MACLTNYTVQCVDRASGKTGCFFFDESHWQKTGEFIAVGPVYPGLVEFYATGEKDTGILRRACYLERVTQ